MYKQLPVINVFNLLQKTSSKFQILGMDEHFFTGVNTLYYNQYRRSSTFCIKHILQLCIIIYKKY